MKNVFLLVSILALNCCYSTSNAGIVRLVLSDGTNTDETLVGFNANATDGFDIYDSEKQFPAGVPLIFTLAGSTPVAINTLNGVATNPRVPIRFRFPVAGNFSITMTEATVSEPLVLEDRLLNVFQNLNANSTYSFAAESGTLNNRFVLHFGQAWMGTASSDWNAASNWSHSSVPVADRHVVISPSAPFQPVVNALPSAPAVCAALTVRAGATVSVAPGRAFTVNGNVLNEGNITLQSDATGTGTLITNGTITGAGGTCVARQFLTGSGVSSASGRHYYITPTTSAATSGVFNAAGVTRLWSHSEVAEAGASGNGSGYTEITVNSTALARMRGYVTRLGADEAIGFTGGVFNTGNQNLTGLTRTGTSNSKRGYHLVGNPYPSFVSWDLVHAASTNMESTIWYRTNLSNEMVFATYNAAGGVGTNGANGLIHPAQGFWVRVLADGQTGSLSFTNAMRSHQAGQTFRDDVNELVRLHISKNNSADETVVYLNGQAQNGLDSYDSRKQMEANSRVQLWSMVGSDRLAINGMGDPIAQPTVPLGVRIPATGTYHLKASELTIDGAAWLEDTRTGQFIDLHETSEYQFHATVGTYQDRFRLHLSSVSPAYLIAGIEGHETSQVSVFTNGNDLHVRLPEGGNAARVTVVDITGRAVHDAQALGTETVLSLNVPTGIYVVRVERSGEASVHRVAVR